MNIFSERKLLDLRKRKTSKIGTNLDKLDSLLGITTDVRRDYSFKSTMNPKGWETMEDGRMVHQDDMYLHQVDKDSGVLDFLGVTALGSSYADEVLVPIAKNQDRLVSVKNAITPVLVCIKEVAKDAGIKVQLID